MTATAVKHQHKWQPTAHLDGCHWYTNVYACYCGASLQVTHERNPLGPMTAVWMEPQYVEVRRDERGRFVAPHWEEKRCQRCGELKAGAPLHSSTVIADREGNIVYEKHTERMAEPEEDDDD